MKILITAPSLNTNDNVSGIATVAQTIIHHNTQHQYFHYVLGRLDKNQNNLKWFMQLIKQLILFPLAIRKNKIDLVHQNLPLDPKGILREYVINLWCRILGIPVVLHVHGGALLFKGTNNIILKKLSKSLFKNSKKVIVLSEIENDALRDNFNHPYAKVLSNSIDASSFKSALPKKILKKPILLYLGRIEKNKGILELIEALRQLKSSFNFSFILCGTGPMKEHCIKTFDEILGNDFEYKGVVSGVAKINIIKNASFFLLPSYFEGLPISLLETMAAGVVPIVTNVGSMKSLIKHNENGFLIEKQNSQDLYEKLEYILLNQALYESMSVNASKTILEKYDIKNYIIELNKIYESLKIF